MSVDSFERHVQPELLVVRRGRLRLFVLVEIERWLRESGARTTNTNDVRGYAAASNAQGDLMKQKRLPEGITIRHGRSCPARHGKRCRCDPTYQAQVWSARDGKRLSRSFPTLAGARTWR
jgi:hypothetical protein